MSGTDDLDGIRHNYKKPYGAKHSIPTIQSYKQQKAQESAKYNPAEESNSSYYESAKAYWYGSGDNNQSKEETPPSGKDDPRRRISQAQQDGDAGDDKQDDDEKEDLSEKKDTTEVEQKDPKTQRKDMKKKANKRLERDVTDPITHLTVTIRDFTDADLKVLPGDDNKDHPTSPKDRKDSPKLQKDHPERADTGLSKLLEEQRTQQESHEATKDSFPPPEYNEVKDELAKIYRTVTVGGSVAICVLASIPATVWALCTVFSFTLDLSSTSRAIFFVAMTAMSLTAVTAVIFGLQEWAQKQVKDTWEEAVWRADAQNSKEKGRHGIQESVIWLNKLVGSIWPLVNPDLFTSLADMLEDVMQASLPTLVRMVSVDDIGQGSEPFRILAIKTLPKGAAALNVAGDGSLQDGGKQTKGGHAEDEMEKTGRQDKDSNKTGQQGNDDNDDSKDDKTMETQGGLEAEEGEFVNLELAFAYKTSKLQKKFRDRAKNAHLYLGFFLPGKLKIPVWVELKGLVGVMRVRLQLTPDPPFVGLSTITFLGQPKVDMSCVPLIKVGPNIMDLPLISNFVQSSLDAAFSQYVAPKSLTLDLRAMLSGDDFKNDTAARGVLRVRIQRCFDFKAGDPGIPLVRAGSSDPYVSVGWAKFGKPVWSTRVLQKEMNPYWNEECFVLVSPEELDADENLRLQLWDSDRIDADDDLGRIELNLKSIMKNEKSNGKMWHRVDAFEALKAGESMPGRCEWEVGYFSKTRLLDYQIENQKEYEGVKTLSELKSKVHEKAEKKLRETAKDETAEIEQQKKEDWEDTQRRMIANAPPTEDYPAGILSVQIHQIVGLEIEKTGKTEDDDGAELEVGDDSLPSSYCTIILNHQKMYKTRTKPKNNTPFFNASTERFVRDWRTASLIVTVRDARVHEDDALLGIVHLPLGKILRARSTSHFNDFFPLAGGIGYGRVRISCVFRSIQLQPPPSALGWEWGTLEVGPDVLAIGNIPNDLRTHRLTFRTNISKGRMHTSQHHHAASNAPKADTDTDVAADASWRPVKNRALLLPVRKRYSSNLLISFRSSSALLSKGKTTAFAVLWLRDLQDEARSTLDIPIYTDGVARASANALPPDQLGEPVGHLRVTLRFWRGLGAGHRRLAHANADIANVLEALGTARDNGELPALVGDPDWRKEKQRAADEDDQAQQDNDSHDENETNNNSDDDDGDSDSDTEEAERARGTENMRSAADDAPPSTPNNNKTKAKEATTPPTPGTSSQLSDSSPSSARTSHDARVNSGGLVNDTRAYAAHTEQLHRRQRGIMQWKGARTAAWMKHKAEGMAEKVRGSFEHQEREPGVETEA